MRKVNASAMLLCFVVTVLTYGGETAVAPVTYSEMTHAIRANDLDALHRLLKNPAGAHVTDDKKFTALHYAAIYGGAEAIEILLGAGADPNAQNQNGATPLIYGAWEYRRTKLLVAKGARVNQAQNDGTTPLMKAASALNNSATGRLLIDRGADVRAIDKFKADALMRGASQGDVEMVKMLLAQKADVHGSSGAGFSGLHGAMTFPDSERVRLLLAAGADPNAITSFGGQVKKGPIALVHLSPLMLAAPYGDTNTISALLKAGALVNEVDIRKMSPLMLSIASDHANPDVVKQLIAAGADVNAKDRNQESVLTWARKFGNPKILALLEAAGAQGEALPPPPKPAEGSQAASAKEAIERAMPLLARSGTQFFHEAGCAACHHQLMVGRVIATANQSGLQADTALRKSFSDAIIVLGPSLRSSLQNLNGPPGDVDPLLSVTMALSELGEPGNELTDSIVHYLATRQDPSGAWFFLGVARPPIEESTITRTAYSIVALQRYGWPARNAEFRARIDLARQWLEEAKPVTTYEWADKITGLRAAGTPLSNLRKTADSLEALQRSDGGWSQTPYLESDAYATGLVLHALYAAGLARPNDGSYQKGVAFLMRTQFPDGSWYVRSRAPKFQPYFLSGFPFDHDQWISMTATSYAVMALGPAAKTNSMAMAKPLGEWPSPSSAK